MKEQIRFRISATKKRCTLIKQIVEKLVPIFGWELGNDKTIEITSWNKNPMGENAVYEIFIILFI